MSSKYKKSVIYIICGLFIAAVISASAIRFSDKRISAEENTVSSISVTSSSEEDENIETGTTSRLTEKITTAIKESTKLSTTLITTEKKSVASSVEASKTTQVTKTTVEGTEAASEKKPTKRFDKIEIPTIFTVPSKTTATPPTTTTKTTSVSGDYSCFDDCAFLGNSRVLALKSYGLCKNVYAAVGLNVDTVYTKSNRSDGTPIIDELKGKSFRKIYIMFGDNECGWGSLPTFIKRYSKVINTVRSYVPGAEIYIQLIMPISKSCSAKNEYGYNQEAINKLNIMIKQLAEDEGVYCVDPGKALAGPDGYLPEEASSDGCHLGKKYCIKWLDYLVENTL